MSRNGGVATGGNANGGDNGIWTADGGDGSGGNLTTGPASLSIGGQFGGIANMNISTGIYNAQLSATSVAAHSNVNIGN